MGGISTPPAASATPIFSVTGQAQAGNPHFLLSGASDPRIVVANFSYNGVGQYTFQPTWLTHGIQWFVFMPSTNLAHFDIIDTGFAGAGAANVQLYMNRFNAGAWVGVDDPWYLIFSG